MPRGRCLQISSGQRFLWCLGHQIRRQIRIRHGCSTQQLLKHDLQRWERARASQRGNLVALPRRETERVQPNVTKTNKKNLPNQSKQDQPASINPRIQESKNPSEFVRACWRGFLRGGVQEERSQKARESKLCTGRTSISPPFHPQNSILSLSLSHFLHDLGFSILINTVRAIMLRPFRLTRLNVLGLRCNSTASAGTPPLMAKFRTDLKTAMRAKETSR